MPIGKLWWGLAGTVLGLVTLSRGLGRRRASDALAREDQRFHAAYAGARELATQHAPVLVLFDGRFIFSDGAERREYAATAPASGLLKATAHTPLSVYTLLQPLLVSRDSVLLTAAIRARLAASQRTIERAERELRRGSQAAELSAQAREDSVEVLAQTQQFVAELLETQQLEVKRLAAFAQALGPLLLRLTEHATAHELAALHAATEAALAHMSQAQQASFEVVIAGAHQARDRSLPLQYFQRRFAEAPGEERRVAFAESVDDPSEARALIGTRRLDRDIAQAFFGNPKRLQRDILGDAAHQLLEHKAFARIF